MKNIIVHVLYWNGHIEILLEDPIGGLILQTRTVEDTEQLNKRFPQRADDFGYIWNGEKLQYKHSNECYEEIPIEDKALFNYKLKEKSQIFDKKLDAYWGNKLDIFLSFEETKEYFTSNGGHVPGHYISTFYRLNYDTPQTSYFAPAQMSVIQRRYRNGVASYKVEETSQSNKSMSYASLIHSFYIQANPEIILSKSKAHLRCVQHKSCWVENCATVTQWFLTEFAQIPEPFFGEQTFSIDAIKDPFGLLFFCSLPTTYIPSFIPFPLLLPIRVFNNAKYHTIDNKPAPVILSADESPPHTSTSKFTLIDDLGSVVLAKQCNDEWQKDIASQDTPSFNMHILNGFVVGLGIAAVAIALTILSSRTLDITSTETLNSSTGLFGFFHSILSTKLPESNAYSAGCYNT